MKESTPEVMIDDDRIEEAAAWFVTLQAADVPIDVLKRWEEWIADSANRDAFDAQTRLWEVVGQATCPPSPSEMELTADRFDGSVPVTAWQEGKHSTFPTSTPSYISPARASRRLALAAMLLTAVAIPIAFTFRPSFLPKQASVRVYETAAGEHKNIDLEDGSTVILGALSTLSSSYSERSRDIVLTRGEALFKVAKDSTRPFIVVAGHGAIRAIGTEFNVRNDESRVVVTVTEGTVEVEPRVEAALARGPDNRITPQMKRRVARLERGQEISYDSRGRVGAIDAADPNVATAWRNGVLRYQSEPLRHVIQDVNRYSRRQILIADPATGDLELTGAVFADKVDDWIRTLDGIFPVEVIEIDDQHVLVRPRPSSDRADPR